MSFRRLIGLLAFYIPFIGTVIEGSIDVCSDEGHMTIPNIGFRFINFRIDSTDTPFHDYHLTEGWYYVGNVTMPEHPPDDIFTCGTKFPVWLNGSHPRNENTVTLMTCQKTISDECSVRNSIKIKKCTGYFVYYLRPTGSPNAGYCFGEGHNGTATKYIPPKPVVRADVMVRKGRGGRVVSSTYFACDFTESLSQRLFYLVSWYMNGNLLYMTPYSSNISDHSLTLTEEIFTSRGFKLGNNVSCSVRAFYNKNGVPGKPSMMAENYFAGIQVLTPDITFSRDEKDASKRSIRLKPTIPIGCQGENCNIALTAYVPVHSFYGQCTGLAFDHSSCGIKLHSTSFNATRDIIITTQDNGQYARSDDVYEIFLRTEETVENRIWSNYFLPPIKVSINDPSTTRIFEGKRCYSHNSLHIKTFDGRVYDNDQDGDYILYRNTKYNTEVQARYFTCGSHGTNMPIKCNCGIAVRAGLDMFEINVCGDKTFIGYHYCDDNILQVKSDGGLKYKIFFPYGTYVQTTLSVISGYTVFNTDIIPSSHDEQRTVGLCGRLDGDISNDFHNRPDSNGAIKTIKMYPINTYVYSWLAQYFNQPTLFIEQWRLKSETENLFSSGFDRQNCIPWTSKSCVCTNATMNRILGSNTVQEAIPCSPNGVASCTKGRIVGSHSCSFTHSRRRRSLKRSPIFPRVYTNDQTRYKRDVTMKNMTEARQHCQDHIRASKIFDLCSEVPNIHPYSSIETCYVNIMLTGSTFLSDATKESLQDSCLTELRRNITFSEKQGKQRAIAEQIEEIACPNECSAAGYCFKGKCKCNSGFGGSDCSVDLSRGPTISGLLDHGMCDVKEMECDYAYVFGSVFTDSENLTCRLEEFAISEDGIRQRLHVHYIPAEFETLVEAMCPLTQTRNKRFVPDTDVFVYGYMISVSNDGNVYEEGKDLFIYDSTCQIAQRTTNSLVFALRDDYCFIDNTCVPNGAINTKNRRLKCNSAVSVKTWTKVEGGDCNRTQNQSSPEGASARTDKAGSNN